MSKMKGTGMCVDVRSRCTGAAAAGGCNHTSPSVAILAQVPFQQYSVRLEPAVRAAKETSHEEDVEGKVLGIAPEESRERRCLAKHLGRKETEEG